MTFEFLWVGSHFYLIDHEFDENSSGTGCDLPKDGNELSYFVGFLCNDVLDLVANETNEYHKIFVEANPPSQYSRLHK